MSDWCITIRGSGPHHSKNSDDADLIAAKTVGALKSAGHSIHEAAFTHGQRQELTHARAHGVNTIEAAKRMFEAFAKTIPTKKTWWPWGKDNAPAWEALEEDQREQWIAAAKRADG